MRTHAERVGAIATAFRDAMARFEARLAGAPPAELLRAPANGGWTAAQIAWHVAAVNESFASILDGTFPIAKPPDAGFVERTWEEIGAGVPAQAQAPSRVQPPMDVTRQEALDKLGASAGRVMSAIGALDAGRAVLVIDAPLVGRLSLYQVGEWAAVHVIRHNRQLKRLIG